MKFSEWLVMAAVGVGGYFLGQSLGWWGSTTTTTTTIPTLPAPPAGLPNAQASTFYEQQLITIQAQLTPGLFLSNPSQYSALQAQAAQLQAEIQLLQTSGMSGWEYA